MSILTIHEKLLDHLVKLRKNDPRLYFMPRKINNRNRLQQGYWFLGNDDYVYVDLWNGTDWKEKVNCIGFVVLPDGRHYLELSAQGCPEVVPFLEKIVAAEPGFDRPGEKYKWYKYFSGDKYLRDFDQAIRQFKPKVDHLIDQEQPPVIRKITSAEFDRYGERVIALRNGQLQYQKTHKITRLSWNTHNWQYPSGWLGKSRDKTTHEGKYGFGYEEWLFDRSKLIGGYHYGFVKGLESKVDRHASKTYELHLYTQNSFRNYYYVGCIRQAEGVSHATSEDIYAQYKAQGWLEEMAGAVQRVEADVKAFRKVNPKLFVNVRFRLADLDLPEELVEIGEQDDNITIDRFKLLGYRGGIVPMLNPELPEDAGSDGTSPENSGHAGNWKNTGRRKRTFKMEQEYDPDHDQMQNAIVEFLRENPAYGYARVDIETSRVDIKALTHGGNWHYFEIKTASPKRNIRDAIGQVMEYAYYPSRERAKQLIIVGDSAPENETIRYLTYLRDRFELPVTYRYFDWDELKLSADFPVVE
ncbi:hypothetical protein [Mucilaginibacter pedocola]|uniref:Uncharacterized protein n=1 Tax=Mucilaginibacter pedocola TaxID=1792845 RepID=A0A1S9PA90_9SPHI|nr:hypothetical protein [Mucilaginibacter pedocola]OOQ57872.1 hypothetical protein BC343_13945 [Mucilaginibacter pedocola]